MVYPEYRRHGIGRKLLLVEVENLARQQGTTKMPSTARKKIRKPKLYEKLGYSPESERAS